MATIIDALYVELGIDASKFTKGQKEALSAFTKTKEGAVKASKEIEKASNDTAEAINKLTRNMLILFGVLTGSRSLKDFVSELVGADAALGRFAVNIGQGPERLAEWGTAVERVGGSTEALGGTFEKLGKILYDARYNGKGFPDDLMKLQQASGRYINTGAGLEKFAEDISAAGYALHKINPSRAHFLLQGLGLDDATQNLIFERGGNIRQYLDSLKPFAPSPQAMAASRDLLAKWQEIRQQITMFADTLVRAVEPAIQSMLKALTDWLNANQEVIKSGIERVGKALGDALTSINWKDVNEGMHGFAAAASDSAKSLGSVVEAIRYLANLNEMSKGWGITKTLNSVAGVPVQGGPGRHPTGPGGVFGFGYTEQPRTPYGSLTRDPSLHGEALAGTVNGQPISRSNPMPVEVTGSSSPSGGGGFWDTVKGIFGMGSASAGTLPGGGGRSAYDDLTATGPSGRARGWWTTDRQKYAYDYLRKNAGLSDAGAKGLVSRWVNVESPNGPGSSNNIAGGHYGIAQWDRTRGKSIWGNPDFDAQLALVARELNGSEARPGRRLRSAATDAEGAVGASDYERASGYDKATGRDNFTARTLGGMRGMDQLLNGHPFVQPHHPASGARLAAALSTIQNTHHVTTSNSSVENHIGNVTVNTQATDAAGVAAGLASAIKRTSMTDTFNNGPN